ncbi:MAG: hypothetical protein V1652_03840 [bacterium]
MEEKDKHKIDFNRIRAKIRTHVMRIVKPMSPVGGLSITDSTIRYFEFRKGKERSISLRLPPGIVASGKVKDRENFIAALKTVHTEVLKGKKDILQVVLTLPVSDVYAQTFTVPNISVRGVDEAAALNIQMISPLDIKTSYYGWQVIGESEGNRKQVEILGAFVPKEIVDPIVTAFHEADYSVVAVEFSSLSLVRSIQAIGMFAKDAPYVVVDVSVEGLDLLITKNGYLYFDYFYPWSLIQGGSQNITIDKLQTVIETELRKMLHFYVGHWGEQINNVIIVTPSLWKRLYNIVKEKFPQIDIEVVVPQKVCGAHGAALRGLVPRSEDMEISLTTVSAKKVFERDQIIRFINGWRNIFGVLLGFMLVLFVVVDLSLGSFAREVNKTVITISGAETQASEIVRAEVQEFNKMVALVKRAKSQDNVVSPLFELLSELAGSSVQYDKILFSGVGKEMVIEGTARREADVLDFKKKVQGVDGFVKVDLPYSSIMANREGRFSFMLRLTVSSLNFAIKRTTGGEDQLGAINETLDVISRSTGNLLRFTDVGFVSSDKPIVVTGDAANRDVVSLLRDQLIASSSFKDVFLFSNDITEQEDGRVSFRIQFMIIR